MSIGVAAALTLVPAAVVVVVGAVLMRRTPARFWALLVTFLLGAVADPVVGVMEAVARGVLGTDGHPPLSLAALLALGVLFFGFVAPLEEGAVWLIARRVLTRTSLATEDVESAAVVQACSAALGLATSEALTNTLIAGPQELSTVLLQSIPMHLLFATVWAVPLGRALAGKGSWWIAGRGLLAVVLLHGTLDMVSASVGRYFPSLERYEVLASLLVEIHLARLCTPKIVSSVRAWVNAGKPGRGCEQPAIVASSDEYARPARHRAIRPRVRRRR